ncbi:hypothetical protein ACLOJK_007780 [Asimina triloba]
METLQDYVYTQRRTLMNLSPLVVPQRTAHVVVPKHDGLKENVVVLDQWRRKQEDKLDMEEFEDMRLLSYKGNIDYKVVNRWVTKMDKIFEYFQCTDELKYAIFMLEEDANERWRTET